MGTYAAFHTALKGITVTGVTKKNEPPRSVNTADLPMGFPASPSSGLGGTTLSCLDNNKRRAARYIILLEAVGQNTQPTNYALVPPMIDSLEGALDGLSTMAGGTTAIWIDYEISGIIEPVAGVDYWAVEAVVTARDT